MKVQTAFRLEKKLIEELKNEAKRHKRSLNNYVELVLSKVVENKPNDETIQAIEDAMENRKVERIENVDDFLNSI
jgi:antitoxin component of RelBE/YafQ-DinJ toxin-antitoxin module